MIIIASLSTAKKSCNNFPCSFILPIVVPKIMLNITKPNTLEPSFCFPLKFHSSIGAENSFQEIMRILENPSYHLLMKYFLVEWFRFCTEILKKQFSIISLSCSVNSQKPTWNIVAWIILSANIFLKFCIFRKKLKFHSK